MGARLLSAPGSQSSRVRPIYDFPHDSLLRLRHRAVGFTPCGCPPRRRQVRRAAGSLPARCAAGSLMTCFRLLCLYGCAGLLALQGRWSLPAPRLTGRSGSPMTRFRLSRLYGCARLPASAGPLVTASAAPHWPFRLTDDALQAVGLYGCAGLLASAGPLVTASARRTGRSGSLMTRFRLSCLYGCAGLYWSCSCWRQLIRAVGPPPGACITT